MYTSNYCYLGIRSKFTYICNEAIMNGEYLYTTKQGLQVVELFPIVVRCVGKDILVKDSLTNFQVQLVIRENLMV